MSHLVDEKAVRVLRAIERKVRPYTDADVARASGLSKIVVRNRLDRLIRAGRVRETWTNDRGPFYEIVERDGG
jgi:DNA-binding IclR family transcriptional regulator